MSQFFTKKGDDGYTGLLGEGRVPKYHPRAEAVGTIDEASAALGLARTYCRSQDNGLILMNIQRDLYGLMAEVAATRENAARFRTIHPGSVSALEEQTERLEAQVEMPREFILPGDSQAGAALSLARAIVRRAERRVAQLMHTGDLENPEMLRYLNRLSSLLFVMELFENTVAGIESPTLAKDKPPRPGE